MMCKGTLHIFETEEIEAMTPPERRCECGSHTWGEMDDLLILNNMWEVTRVPMRPSAG